MKRKIIVLAFFIAVAFCLFSLKWSDGLEEGDAEHGSSKDLLSQGGVDREESEEGSKASEGNRPNNEESDYHKWLLFSDLDPEKLLKIRMSLKSSSPFFKAQKNVSPLKTGNEALEFLIDSISMAFIPQRYAEDDEMFYFSGGNILSPVFDFSTGIAVDKTTRAITGWDIR